MRLPVRLSRLAVVSGVGALVGAAALVAAPASAASGDTTPTSVTVFLAAPHPSALAALASRTGLSAAQRRAALVPLLPDEQAHRAVAATLRAEGLTITGETTWSITATGPASTVNNSFGSRAALPAHASAAQRQTATGPLPAVPSPLSGLVTAAFPTTGGPAAFHAATGPSLSGADFRNAYTAATVAPSTGFDPDGALTVATVQLSSWQPEDLVEYAEEHGLSLRPGQFTSVLLGKGPRTHTGAVDYSGDSEVDLDQESILSTDPSANQRAYFAPNTEGGNGVAVAQVLDDVLQDSHAAGGGDPHIAALSTSWGNCESGIGSQAIRTVLEPEFQALVAAGVTVFAASGDFGIYDCGGTTVNGVYTPTTTSSVDYPASSPEVVGVGGTSLTTSPAGSAGAANTGTNWAETAWSCTDPTSCEEGPGGSGGGASSLFAQPAYQTANIGDSLYLSGRRLVPDLAADADPATGFTLHTTDLGVDGPCNGASDCTYGGTSLGSPTSAALLTSLLGRYGRSTGIGDIHAGLYAAFAATQADPPTSSSAAFRDVTSGSNGSPTDQGSDPSTSAAVGYDTVTGLGSPLWLALAPYLLNLRQVARAQPRVSLTNAHSSSRPTQLTATWSIPASGKGPGGARAAVVIRRIGSPAPVFSNPATAPQGSRSFTGAAGATYTLTVSGQDTAGHVVPPVTSTVVVPRDDKSFSLHGSWRRSSSSSDIAGSHIASAAFGAYARVTATGRSFAIHVRTGPSYGKLTIYRGRTQLKTVDEFARHVGHKTVTFFGTRGPHRQTFQFRYSGAKNSRSSSSAVTLDALYISS